MRSKKSWLVGAGILCAGLLYGYLLIPMGFRIRCPFRMLTGLRCPGCGITDLCLGLLHGQFQPQHNWGLVVAAPIIFWLTVRRDGSRVVRWTTWGVLAFLLGWGVVRNIWHL